MKAQIVRVRDLTSEKTSLGLYVPDADEALIVQHKLGPATVRFNCGYSWISAVLATDIDIPFRLMVQFAAKRQPKYYTKDPDQEFKTYWRRVAEKFFDAD